MNTMHRHKAAKGHESRSYQALPKVYFNYRKDTEPLYHAFMYSPVSLLSVIYPLPAMLSLLVTLYVQNIVPWFKPQ